MASQATQLTRVPTITTTSRTRRAPGTGLAKAPLAWMRTLPAAAISTPRLEVARPTSRRRPAGGAARRACSNTAEFGNATHRRVSGCAAMVFASHAAVGQGQAEVLSYGGCVIGAVVFDVGECLVDE